MSDKNPLFWDDDDDPFRTFIENELGDPYIEDDTILREKYGPKVVETLNEVLGIRDAGARWEAVMTDQQRITQELLVDLIHKQFHGEWRYLRPKEQIALTIAWSWLVLLMTDDTIVRRTEDDSGLPGAD